MASRTEMAFISSPYSSYTQLLVGGGGGGFGI